MESKLVCFESDSQSIDNVRKQKSKQSLDQLTNEQTLRKYLIHQLSEMVPFVLFNRRELNKR